MKMLQKSKPNFVVMCCEGHDPRRVQGQLQSAIREVLMEKKHHLILAAQDYASSRLLAIYLTVQ